MNENAKKWIEALRSGDYEQTRGALARVGGGYCCLGVACDLAEANGVHLNVEVFPSVVDDSGMFAYSGYTALLPPSVQEWLGLRTDGGDFYYCDAYDGAGSLAEANDEGSTFDEIANIIESEPEGLFNG